jgi:hypothetical protein
VHVVHLSNSVAEQFRTAIQAPRDSVPAGRRRFNL